ncbi:MAG: hypothetical protein DSZ12_05575 [Sulfurovum sp.]|nr:MAG: hypothetical protein DSZ08_03785 [Sulfurovum sp.]RUM74403.1 MAG: hypothetical protein DSZ12_05575 [Sulfurovum sp.]
MKNFFYLEGAYLMIGLFALLITLYVSTRPFMSKGALKKGIFWVSLVIAVMVGTHYFITTKRMKQVRVAFEKDLPILCESRASRIVSQTVIVQKSKSWTLQEDNFISPYYTRPFFTARCIVK